MAERIARIEEVAGDYRLWKNRVENRDEAQDKALYALERRADALEGILKRMDDDRKADRKKRDKLLKIAIGFSGCSAADAFGWNAWNRMKPFLAPFMSEEFFWFSIGVLGFLAILYALLNIPFNRKEK